MIVRHNRRGAAGSQYAIIIGLIAVVSLLAISSFGGNIGRMLTGVSNRLTTVTNGGTVGGGSSGNMAPTQPPVFQNTSLSLPVLLAASGIVTATDDAGGGTISYSAATGTLPPGTAWDSAQHMLTGKPWRQGSYSFQVTASNSVGSTTATITTTITSLSIKLHNKSANGTQVVYTTIPAGNAVTATGSFSNPVYSGSAHRCGAMESDLYTPGATKGLYLQQLNSTEKNPTIVYGSVGAYSPTNGSVPTNWDVGANAKTPTNFETSVTHLANGNVSGNIRRLPSGTLYSHTGNMASTDDFILSFGFDDRSWDPYNQNTSTCSVDVVITVN